MMIPIIKKVHFHIFIIFLSRVFLLLVFPLKFSNDPYIVCFFKLSFSSTWFKFLTDSRQRCRGLPLGLVLLGLETSNSLIQFSLARHIFPAYYSIFETMYFWIFGPVKIFSISAFVHLSYCHVSVLYMGSYIFLRIFLLKFSNFIRAI